MLEIQLLIEFLLTQQVVIDVFLQLLQLFLRKLLCLLPFEVHSQAILCSRGSDEDSEPNLLMRSNQLVNKGLGLLGFQNHSLPLISHHFFLIPNLDLVGEVALGDEHRVPSFVG